MSPRFFRPLWKFSSGVVIAMMVFGVPLSDAIPLLPRTPIVYAQGAGAAGVSGQPSVPSCNGLPVGVQCTDYGVAQASINKIKARIDYQLTMAAVNGFFNAITFITQTLAYDTAEWMANGFKGNAPGIFTEPFGDYTKNLVLDATGEFMGTFSERFTEGQFGFNLCRPPNFPQLSLELALSFPELSVDAIQRPRPKCSWSEITQNWDTASQSLSNLESIQNIRGYFSTGGNDVAFGIGAHVAYLNFVEERRQAGVLERLAGGGYKDVKSFISGKIETPAALVERQVEANIIEKPAAYDEAHWQFALNNAFEVGWVQLGVITASTFTNVLLSRLMQKIQSGLFKTTGSGSRGLPNLLDPFAVLSGQQAQEIVAEQFSDLKTPQITKTGETLDLVTELTGCPAEARTQWNCALDEGFAVVLRQDSGMTVRQALDQGFLNPNWELIPSTRLKDNQDPSCRSRAFCVANLRKLRLARVLPIGWELAAESPANQQACAKGSCVTLGEVMRRFDDCNEQGVLDATHPYCHLISPNWVLTAFPAQCRTEGYGNQLLAGTAERVQECQDTVTCLERDANGNCKGGYGYCMAEHTFWQFEAPSCEEQFVSCRTFTPRQGAPGGTRATSYLRSTLDYGTCNESNVGCMWYATTRDAAPDAGTDAWLGTAVPTKSAAGMDRVFFDKNVTACDAGNDGCAALRRVEAGKSALNLVENGSFERLNEAEGRSTIQNWTASRYVRPEVAEGAASAHGTNAFPVVTEGGRTNIASNAVQPLHQYVLSFYARLSGGSPSDDGAIVYVRMNPASGTTLPLGTTEYYRSAGCSELPASLGDARANVGVSIPAVGNEWTRFSCSFVAPPGVVNTVLNIVPGSAAVLIDAVQLEEGEVPTPFVDGLSASLASVSMKIPPSELSCSGSTETDHPLCGNYARVCRQSEAGCQGYRPSAGGTAPEVPAVLSPADLCPAECAGYAEFRKQASTFDLVRSADPRLDDPDDDTSAFLIPATAAQCRAQDVGCELFTNLDVQSQGGEAQEAFRYLRSCEKPGSDSQTYYTWEGSDTSGYQLKTWGLKRDALAPAPQGPKTVEKTGPDGVLKDPLACNEQTYLQALDPDCRQFYDPQGNVFYRFESQTVLSTPDCRSYRKEGSTAADCGKTGGTFNQATGQCTYLAEAAGSLSCAPAVAGCRAYVGTQGKAQEEVFFEEFAGTSFQARGEIEGGGGAVLASSDEALLVGDKSLRIQRSGGDNTAFVGPMDLQPGALYEVAFWAKANTPGASVSVAAAAPDQDAVTVGTVPIAPEWRTYRVGPFATGIASAQDYLALTITGSDLTFIDKIRVERVQDVSYVVKDSWNTPASCDVTPEGVPQPQAMLGCRAYTDRAGAQVHVRQFTRLCRETAIGCTAYVNTFQTDSPYGQSWSKPSSMEDEPPELTRVPGDRYEYYIEDPSKFCRPEATGCRAYGKPNYAQDRLTLKPEQPFTTVYLQPDPSGYDESLCSEAELFCEAYTYSAERGGSGESGTAYFRAPADHTCEYRTSVVVPDGTVPGLSTAGQVYDGWFRTGTDIPCHSDLLKAGSIFDQRLTGDPGFNPWAVVPAGSSDWRADYRGWAGTCPQRAAECTEFRDVNDTSDILHPQGRPYFVLRNGDVDETSCNGQVDPGRGCVLFQDTSDARTQWNSAATYNLYQSRAYQPVAPVDCDLQPDHPSCLAARACRHVAIDCSVSSPPCFMARGQGPQGLFNLMASVEGRACSDDSSCRATFNGPGYTTDVVGDCVTENDTNVVIKVKADRACSEWLSCATSETVYDPREGRYKSICADLALCNKAGAAEGDDVPFCANYVDRSLGSPQTRLLASTVMNATWYSQRPSGFGSKDYSGVTVPDHFQVMDAELVPIASMLTTDVRVKNQYKKDYRLAVPVPMRPTSLVPIPIVLPAPDAREIISAPEGLRPYACWYVLTNSYGLSTDDAGNLASGSAATKCWLSLDQAAPPSLGVVGSGSVVSLALSIPLLMARFMDSVAPQLDQTLARSFPDTQCKAAPEADAPFGGEFVTEWDDTVTPPEPKRVASGYSQVNFCEYGEACACTYKRVEYGASNSKFYEPLSTDVVNAVCVGGSRDGQPCALDAGVKGSVPTGEITVQNEGGEDQAVNLAQVFAGENTGVADPRTQCGDGGICRPITKTTLVRGVSGQCLQYDLSRTIAGDLSRNECLLWSPNPVFSGPSDPYHWIPTSGFQPPQSSGRYYCLSPFREPKTIPFRPRGGVTINNEDLPLGEAVGYKANSNGLFAGQIKKFFYSDKTASDKSCLDPSDIPWWATVGVTALNPAVGVGATIAIDAGGCDGNESGAALDGGRAAGTDMGASCESADDDQSPVTDFSVARLVTTGRGVNRGYAEYAVMLDAAQIGRMIAGYGTSADMSDPTVREIVKENSLEDAVASFSFDTDYNRIGCGYSEDWVEGISVSDYNTRELWEPMDAQWRAGFRRELQANGGVLDRRSAQIVTEDGTLGGIPVKVDCSVNMDGDDTPDNDPEEDTGCYLKTWTLNYRAKGQDAFVGFRPEYGRQGLDHLSRSPIYSKCDADHPYFAIRAVFENTNQEENAQDPADVNPASMQGPFQLAGFWVTACSPNPGPRYIYMKVNLSTADVCRELAETISKDSNESTAFTDRNWSQGTFSVPRAGFQWSSTNIPFGASLATRDAGVEPLYMSGVRQAGANPLHPPAFTHAGQTYFQPTPYPTSNWGLLSNVFARIYRIYGYSTQGVGDEDWACTNPASPNFGNWCPNLDDVSGGEEISAQYCGVGGTCVRQGSGGESIFDRKVCNSFSGVNRGLDCSTDPDICHRGPVSLNEFNVPQPLFVACEVAPFAGASWDSLEDGRRWVCTGDDCLTGAPVPAECSSCTDATRGCTKSQAAKCGAFRCADSSAISPGGWGGTNLSFCSSPSDNPETEIVEVSSECPARIIAGAPGDEDPLTDACVNQRQVPIPPDTAQWVDVGIQYSNGIVLTIQNRIAALEGAAGDEQQTAKDQWIQAANLYSARASSAYLIAFNDYVANCLAGGGISAANCLLLAFAAPGTTTADTWRTSAAAEVSEANAASPASMAGAWVNSAASLSIPPSPLCAPGSCTGDQTRTGVVIGAWQDARSAYRASAAAAQEMVENASDVSEELEDLREQLAAAQAQYDFYLSLEDGQMPLGQCEKHPWAQCTTSADCIYGGQHWWPSGPANTFVSWPANISDDVDVEEPTEIKKFSTKLGNMDEANPIHAYMLSAVHTTTDAAKWVFPGIDAGCRNSEDDPGCLLREAFSPAIPAGLPNNEPTKFFGRTIGNDITKLFLAPGFVPAVGLNVPMNHDLISGLFRSNRDGSGVGDDGIRSPIVATPAGGPPFVWFRPRVSGETVVTGENCLCNGNDRVVDPPEFLGTDPGAYCYHKAPSSATSDRIYACTNATSGSGPNPRPLTEMVAHYAACESAALMFNLVDSTPRSQGTCRNGSRAGGICFADEDCRPAGMSITDYNNIQADAGDWCRPVTPRRSYNEACWVGSGNNTGSEGVTTDNNLCTRPPGYWPRPALCKDPDDEYCGLLGYDLGDLEESVNDSTALPTDVTPGFATPDFLNPEGDNLSDVPLFDYDYVRYYNPIPPLTAAPDIRSCQGGTCRPDRLGTLGVDGVQAGVVNGGAGSHVASLRFYAWASHEQMPLRKVRIDWGDGNITELPDAHLKNHKPYCGGSKECSNAPGLTCQADNDCPAGFGTCVTIGSCVDGPKAGLRCTDDRACDSADGEDGVCQPRVFFGNDEGACEEQYFEFRHAYSCLEGADLLQACPGAGAGRCSRDQNRACTADDECAAGDLCLTDLAPTGGCFDNTTKTCRFTPRVFLQDNWGWCTGECRTDLASRGRTFDPAGAPILHVNGGCYDATRVKSNVDAISSIGINECNPAVPSGSGQRPWVVFPGSIQVLSGETQ